MAWFEPIRRQHASSCPVTSELPLRKVQNRNHRSGSLAEIEVPRPARSVNVRQRKAIVASVVPASAPHPSPLPVRTGRGTRVSPARSRLAHCGLVLGLFFFGRDQMVSRPGTRGAEHAATPHPAASLDAELTLRTDHPARQSPPPPAALFSPCPVCDSGAHTRAGCGRADGSLPDTPCPISWSRVTSPERACAHVSAVSFSMDARDGGDSVGV